jgi:hypothetical protein
MVQIIRYWCSLNPNLASRKSHSHCGISPRREGLNISTGSGSDRPKTQGLSDSPTFICQWLVSICQSGVSLEGWQPSLSLRPVATASGTDVESLPALG